MLILDPSFVDATLPWKTKTIGTMSFSYFLTIIAIFRPYIIWLYDKSKTLISSGTESQLFSTPRPAPLF